MAKTDDSETLASVMARDIAARIRTAADEYNAAVVTAESRGIHVKTRSTGGTESGRFEIVSIALIAGL